MARQRTRELVEFHAHIQGLGLNEAEIEALTDVCDGLTRPMVDEVILECFQGLAAAPILDAARSFFGLPIDRIRPPVQAAIDRVGIT